MKIIVLNSGSSSLKYQLFDMANLKSLASGLIEQIGDGQSQAYLTIDQNDGQRKSHLTCPIPDHQKAIDIMAQMLKEHGCLQKFNELAAIGHRVVHGGEEFHNSVLIDQQVITTIKNLIPLAPLHNPANLLGIEVIKKLAPDLPQVAVFDTAFHQTIPPTAFVYGLPYHLYEEQKVRRYGFHGTSHYFVAKEAARYLGRSFEQLKVISLHLGNGTSATAINNGKSIDTSMGMTPLEGLMMGTRSGDLDPAILFYLNRQTGMTIQELDDLLNKESGLKGICQQNDMRTIIDQSRAGDHKSALALQIFCYRIKKYIGSYLAILNGADAIIFTGGIGENSSIVRELACQDLENLGITISPQENSKRSAEIMAIQTPTSPIKVLVIPTNEEFEIANQTVKLLGHGK